MVALLVGIAIAIAVGAAFAYEVSTQSVQNGAAPNATKEGKNIVVNIEEKLGISETP